MIDRHAPPETFPVPTHELDPADAPIEFVEEVAGFYFRSVLIKKANICVSQHVHDYDHALYVGAGSARVWVDDELKGDYPAGHAIEIKAGKRHCVMSLEPNTRLSCIHDRASAERIKARGV